MIRTFQFPKASIDLTPYELKTDVKPDVKHLLSSDFTNDEFYNMNNLFDFIKTFHYKENNNYYNYVDFDEPLTNLDTKLINCTGENLVLDYSTASNSSQTITLINCYFKTITETRKKLSLSLINSYVEEIYLKDVSYILPSMYLKKFNLTDFSLELHSNFSLDFRHTRLEYLRINNDFGVAAFLSVLLPNTTTYIDIDATEYNICIEQDEPYAYYNNNGYEHLYLNVRKLDGFIMPLYSDPYDSWHSNANFAIYVGNISQARINYIKCFPTVLAFFKKIWEDDHDFYIYSLHLIDSTGGGLDDHTTRYMADTACTNATAKNVYINNFICEAMINDVPDFRDVFKNLCGANMNVQIKNSTISTV